ncbi:peptidoglycan-binding domain-containing protein [Phaeovulum sp.]|uniref:peptidoglycan-binding domain-containing protein n=1 Tax=Phaeovulum sp. TaxID=2934796 RepID=UPI0039E300E8
MFTKGIATTSLIAALAMTPAAPALAGGGDAVVGGIIGGIIGGAIVNEHNRHRAAPVRRAQPKRYQSSISSAQRESNREVQVALNHFGYGVGAPDGAIGPRSRAAISDYQMTLGYPATGQLTEYERSHLVASYHRAVAGGALTMQQAAANPMGMRGLLVQWRDEAAGIPSTPPSFAPQGTAPGVMAVAPAPEAPAAELPQFVAILEPAAPAMPSFLGGVVTQASLASHCNRVNMATSSNGGFVTAAAMADPGQALGEQFCLARGYAISQGEELAAAIPGFTPAQITAQCESFGPAMKESVSALSLQPRDAVLAGVSEFALESGMAPAQLVGTARVCLSVGYRTDNMDVALASGLLLTALGERQYAELMGHHLAMGFGASVRPDLAVDWYQMGLDALSNGATPVFAPHQPGRADVIRKAAYTLGGRADLLPTEAVPAVLPQFAVPQTTAPAQEGTGMALVPVVQPAPTAAPGNNPPAATAGGGLATAMRNLTQLPALMIKP